MKPFNYLQLFTLAAIWGSSFLFMRVASPEFGPISLIMIRATVAMLFLVPIVLYKKRYADIKKYWKTLFIFGLINTAIPFTLLSYATLYFTAGTASILNATMPFFTTLIAYVVFKDKLPTIGFIGLILGFAGVSIIASTSATADGLAWPAIIAALCATFCYGVSTHIAKIYLSKADSLSCATGSQIFASMIMLPLGILFWPDNAISTESWISAIVLGIVCSGVAFIIFFSLVSQVGPTNTSTVTYLIPIFGILFGIIFLEESVTYVTLVGSICILFGVMLITGLFTKYFRKKTPKNVPD